MTEDELRAMALALPETTEGFNMGSVFFKANGKDIARLLGGGRAVFTGVPIEEIELLAEAQPHTFSSEPHYRDYKCIVARLETLEPAQAQALLERRFRAVAKKAVIKAWEGRQDQLPS